MKPAISNKFIILGTALSAMLLSGCTASRMGAIERRSSQSPAIEKEFPNETFSDAQKFMYAIERVKPVKKNNLDNFNAFESINTDNLIANAAGASLAIPNSPWLALSNFIVSQRRNGTSAYRDNLLILLAPIQSGQTSPKEQLSSDVEKAADLLTERSIEIITDAYKSAGTPVNVIEPDLDKRSGYLSWFSPTIYVPNGLEYCPNDIKTSSELSDSQLRYCTTIVSNRAFVNFTNPDAESAIPFAIKGNYVYKAFSLPDGFPVQHLKSKYAYTYLFMPSFIYRRSDILDNVDKSTLKKLFEDGRASLNPVLIDAHTQQYHYFNADISKYQTKELERIDGEFLFEKLM